MILESIVTTMNDVGRVNIAPMGPTVDAPITQITLRPFRTSRTYANIKLTGRAIVHVTDDAWLFSQAAVDAIDEAQTKALVQKLDSGIGFRLIDCHRWFALQVQDFSEDTQRATIRCQIKETKTVRPFFGFNRAKHAVIEAAILATRTHLISKETINQQLEQLKPLVEKTGGQQERRAFDFLSNAIAQRIAGTGDCPDD